jgi:hypothetical protein
MYLCLRPVECRRETRGNAHAVWRWSVSFDYVCSVYQSLHRDDLLMAGYTPRQLSARMRNSANTCMAVSYEPRCPEPHSGRLSASSRLESSASSTSVGTLDHENELKSVPGTSDCQHGETITRQWKDRPLRPKSTASICTRRSGHGTSIPSCSMSRQLTSQTRNMLVESCQLRVDPRRASYGKLRHPRPFTQTRPLWVSPERLNRTLFLPYFQRHFESSSSYYDMRVTHWLIVLVSTHAVQIWRTQVYVIRRRKH